MSNVNREPFEERMRRYFPASGYARIELHKEGMQLYCYEMDGCAYLIWIIGDKALPGMTAEVFQSQYGIISRRYIEAGYRTMQIMTLFVTSDCDTIKAFGLTTPFWIADEEYGRLIIYENQPEDYLGLRNMMEQNLHFGGDVRNADGLQKNGVFVQGDKEQPVGKDSGKTDIRGKRKARRLFLWWLFKNTTWVTFLLLIINCFIFLFLQDAGDDISLLWKYGINSKALFEDKEIYRLFTCMFLHVNAEHIGSNMLALVVAGYALEKRWGHLWFGIAYLVTGLLASFTSALVNLYMDNGNIFSVGASGAVYGIIGCLMFWILTGVGDNEIGGIPRFRMMFFVIYLFYGMTDAVAGDVDNAAHIGGLLSGTLLALFFWLFIQRHSQEKRRRKLQQ